jgi:acyl dehydratase
MYSQQESPARDRMRNTLRVGDAARRTRTVTVRDIELFTELTGDRDPLHYDPLLARRSRFGGIVVQGGVTSGLLNAVVAEDLPSPGQRLPSRRLGLPRPGPARRRDHRRSSGHLFPGRQTR